MLSDPETIPSLIARPEDLFSSIEAFQGALIDAIWLWPLLGCARPHASSVHSDGDILTHVLPVKRSSKKGSTTPVLRIQTVIHAKKFPGLNSPVHYAHLVISLVAWWHIDGVAGAPLISFYRKGEDGRYRLSIHRDIDEVFHARKSSDEDGDIQHDKLQ